MPQTAKHSAALLALAIAACLCGLGAPEACAQGIDWRSDWPAARKHAAKTGRPILVDAYTTWCAPCKRMDREVFSAAEAGDAVNDAYVAVRLDMEAGAGVAFAKTYQVAAYPTVLVLNAGAEELDRLVGFAALEPFVAFARKAAGRETPDSDSYANLSARYAAGAASVAELGRLTDLAHRLAMPNTPVYAHAYLAGRGDFASADARGLVLRHARPGTALFDTLLARRLDYAQDEGEYFVETAIARAVDGALFPEGGGAMRPRAARRLLRQAYPVRADSAYVRYEMRRAREAGKAKRFGRWALRGQERYPSDDPDELGELIYIFEQRLPGWRVEEVARLKARREDALSALD